MDNATREHRYGNAQHNLQVAANDKDKRAVAYWTRRVNYYYRLATKG